MPAKSTRKVLSAAKILSTVRAAEAGDAEAVRLLRTINTAILYQLKLVLMMDKQQSGGVRSAVEFLNYSVWVVGIERPAMVLPLAESLSGYASPVAVTSLQVFAMLARLRAEMGNADWLPDPLKRELARPRYQVSETLGSLPITEPFINALGKVLKSLAASPEASGTT